ncbi:MAG: hypothetical protein CK427_12530 [Leptospira sp.]|nr:MAG: hypothetical protein CK427_12530 [Leptospira sp.]
MNSISRTEAHKVFADLYRKTRSPEHQKLIDEAILRSNDVFIRIDLIKKVDEDQQAAARAKLNDTPEEKPKRREPRREQESTPKETSRQKQDPDPRKKKKEPTPSGGGGFLSALFGVNPNIVKFAKESDAIDIGIFGRNPTISNSVEKIFKYLKEDQIIYTIQALRLCEQQGWRMWNPLIYNIINNFNRFFNAFISLDSLFLDRISPEVFLDRSMKMQMFYARLLSREDSKEVIINNVPEMVKQDEKLSSKLPQILSGLNYGLSLESTRPKLSEAISAFYIVVHKKMTTWEDITKILSVPALTESKYQAGPEITKEVELTVARLTDEISTKIHKRNELNQLKNRYFKIDEKGKISFDFLGLVIEDYFAHHYPENMNIEGVKSQFKTIPHKLLYLLLRDFQSVFANFIEGYIKVGDKNQQNEVLLVTPGLFKPELEAINLIVRSLDAFNRKYPSFQYNFQQFSKDFTNGASDQIASNILSVLTEAAEFFGTFANKINVIVENHLLAKQYEADGNLNEKIYSTKEKIIEEIKILHRFIPHYDSRVVTRDRMNGLMVSDVFVSMAKLLYNYAIIFKDKLTTNKLTLNRKIEADLQALNSEYERLTGKPFDNAMIEKNPNEQVEDSSDVGDL